jgi:hypothetical protein
VPTQYWNRKTGRISKDLPSTYGNAEKMEKNLTEKLRNAEDMVEYALKKKECMSHAILKRQFSFAFSLEVGTNE